MSFSNPGQLKSYLQKNAELMGISINHTYNTYFSRRLLELVAKYSFGQIIVKGSFSQYVHLQKLCRPITDIDLVSPYNYSIVDDILKHSVKKENGDSEIDFQFDKEVKKRNTGIYEVGVLCSTGTIRHRIGVDIKCNSTTILETQYKPVRPLFTKDTEFYINTPSYEEHLAEKLCIIAESMQQSYFNPRIKDFYDIYQLHGGQYDYEKLSIYFKKLLALRGKINLFDVNITGLDAQYILDHQDIWNNTRRKKEFLDQDVDLNQAVYYTKAVLSEQLQKSKNRMNCY